MEHLKQLRMERGISQQKLGEMFSLTQQSIYKYENDLAEPDITTLKQLASYFHTSIDYLVEFESTDALIEKTGLEHHEMRHLDMYRKMSSTMQEHLDSLLDDIVSES